MSAPKTTIHQAGLPCGCPRAVAPRIAGHWICSPRTPDLQSSDGSARKTAECVAHSVCKLTVRAMPRPRPHLKSTSLICLSVGTHAPVSLALPSEECNSKAWPPNKVQMPRCACQRGPPPIPKVQMSYYVCQRRPPPIPKVQMSYYVCQRRPTKLVPQAPGLAMRWFVEKDPCVWPPHEGQTSCIACHRGPSWKLTVSVMQFASCTLHVSKT
jgi:hypothetical protein